MRLSLLLPLLLLRFAAGLDVLQLEPDLDGYQVVLRRTASRMDKLQVFHSIWGAIRADFASEAEKAKSFYAQLSSFIQNEQTCASGSVGRAACELQQEVRRHLRQLLAQRLANLLNAEEGQQGIQAYGMYVAASVEPALVRDILVQAVADVYLHRPPEALAQQLATLHAPGDEVSFKMMIEAQLALYWHYRYMHDSSDAYLFAVAHILAGIRGHHMYTSVPAEMERRLLELADNLPAVLSSLFDAQGFCLLNRAHRGYIYTTITDEWNYGVNGRQVFVWHEQNFTDSAGQMRAFIQEPQRGASASGTDAPLFTLRGELFQWYFFVDASQGNRLAVLRSGSPSPASSVWSIRYVGDALVLRQRDLTLCSAEMHDRDRRLVKALPGHLQMPPADECLWLPVRCAKA